MRNRLAVHHSLEGVQEHVQQVEMEFRWWLEEQRFDSEVLSLLVEEWSEVEDQLNCQKNIGLEHEAHEIGGHLQECASGKIEEEAYGELFMGIKTLERHLAEELKRA
jgi:hypothetical protein